MRCLALALALACASSAALASSGQESVSCEKTFENLYKTDKEYRSTSAKFDEEAAKYKASKESGDKAGMRRASDRATIILFTLSNFAMEEECSAMLIDQKMKALSGKGDSPEGADSNKR